MAFEERRPFKSSVAKRTKVLPCGDIRDSPGAAPRHPRTLIKSAFASIRAHWLRPESEPSDAARNLHRSARSLPGQPRLPDRPNILCGHHVIEIQPHLTLHRPHENPWPVGRVQHRDTHRPGKWNAGVTLDFQLISLVKWLFSLRRGVEGQDTLRLTGKRTRCHSPKQDHDDQQKAHMHRCRSIV